jgi:signal transduction histidine kinase
MPAVAPVRFGGRTCCDRRKANRREVLRSERIMTAELQIDQSGDTLLQQFDAVMDAIDYGVILMGPDLRAKIVNRAFRDMWGVSADFIRATPTMAEFIRHIHRTHHLYDVSEIEFDDYVAQRVERVQSGNFFEGTMNLRDGRIIHHQVRTLPDGGRLLTYFDITRLKRSEDAANRAKDAAEAALSSRGALLAQFNAVLDTIEYGVIFMGADLRARIVNRAFRVMWGVSDDFIQAKRPTMAEFIQHIHRTHDLYGIPESEFDAYVARRVERVQSGASFDGEMKLRDGRVLFYQIQALPDGGRLLTYFDITQLKRNEEAAKEAKDAAEVALSELKFAQNRLIQTEKLASLGQLTAGIAHEIKNPLNFVNNFSALSAELAEEMKEALAGKKLNDVDVTDLDELLTMIKSNLDKIRQHGQRADAIVKNMLMHSRESGGEWRSANINSLVDDSLNLAYYGTSSEKNDIKVELVRSFDPDAGEVEMFPQDLTRAILNLVLNGLYATFKRKRETIDDAYEPAVTAVTRNLGETVEIAIRDNGHGIAFDIRDKIFNPFFTTKPAGEGTGLGLSLSYDIIVKQHAGNIEFDSQPGDFTEFRVTIPRSGGAGSRARQR